ncbi:MAG: M24 family metallopeptidase [Endomicrobiales bacterium]
MPVRNCLITNTADLFYLTGVNLEGFWLLVTGKTSYIFSHPLLAGQLAFLLPQADIISGDDVFKLFVDFCRKNKIKNLGIDTARVSFSLATRLSKTLTLKDISAFTSAMRAVKDDLELKRIRASCRLAAKAVRYAETLLSPGKTEEEIAFKIDDFFAKNLARPSFTTIVASGPNSANPHHISTQRRLKKEDIVLIDLGCVYQGYCSDLTRTFILGKMKGLKKQVFTLVQHAKQQAQKKLFPGVPTRTVDEAARTVISSGGHGEAFVHSTGHGVGIDVHEAPRLSPKDKGTLKAGMVVTVEPGIYLKGQFGVRLEDTLLVTSIGSEVLTI